MISLKMVEIQAGSITKEEVLALINRKIEIERDIMNLKRVLDVNGVGMNDLLVDAEGYPRDDIDVYQIRHARHQIICLQNDVKALMAEIEEGMYVVQENEKVHSVPMDHSVSSESGSVLEPFAKVNLVHPSSPAHTSGLQVGDLIINFGSINDENFSTLGDIAFLVEHSVGRDIAITVLRNSSQVHLTLTPMPWQGNGYLGCNILSLESIDR